MIAASERIVETLFETENADEPFPALQTVSTLEEVFFTSFVEGSKLELRDAMEFIQSDNPPREAEEQLIVNNRNAGSYAGQNLYRPLDEALLRDLAYILTEGMEGGGGEYRAWDDAEIPSMQGEPYTVPQAGAVPEKMRELLDYLSDSGVHPLIKAGVAQAWLLIVRPFPDGNERLGRLLSSMILIRAGYTFFSEISLSALIARRGYGYYEAVANLLREENGGDLTYFLDYFMDLLSRAVEERRLRQQRREEQAQQAEREMAQTVLAAPASAEQSAEPTSSQETGVISLPEQNPEPGKAEAPSDPVTVPNPVEEGGDFLDGFIQVSPNGSEPLPDAPPTPEEMISLTRVRDRLYALADTNVEPTKSNAEMLLGFMDRGIYSFTSQEIKRCIPMTKKQIFNFIARLRAKGIIESDDIRRGGYKTYRFHRDLPPLARETYAPEVLQLIESLRTSHRSSKERRIGVLLSACLPKGLITADDCPDPESAAKLQSDMQLTERMGLVSQIRNGVYRIKRQIKRSLPSLTVKEQQALSILHQRFADEEFTQEMVMDALGLARSSVASLLRQFVLLNLLDCREDAAYSYRLLVNPNDHPTLFGKGKADNEGHAPVESEPEAEPRREPDVPAEPADSGKKRLYSEEVCEALDRLEAPVAPQRDKRLGRVLRHCMAKGLLMKSDYEEWHYSDSMWASDIKLALQLGLIRKLSPDLYALNRQLKPALPQLKPMQKKTVSDIYEAFGDQEFSAEMIIATLNYSTSFTYASLHKLTLLRILDQRSIDDVNHYQLRVNPEQNPECFDVVA